MKTKILVLGATGMLGHMVVKVLSRQKRFAVVGTHFLNRRDKFYFNVFDGMSALERMNKANKGFHYIINCIGITADKINRNESASVKRAMEINSVFPYRLAEFGEKNNINIIHISTDGVFSGKAKRYNEDFLPDCPDIYGITKCLGEVKSNNVLTIRCSIFGPSPIEKGGLFEWLRFQPDAATVNGYTNHVWNGVTTVQFAELCQAIIVRNQFKRLRKLSYVFHFSPNQPVTKYKLLLLVKSVFKQNITIKPFRHVGGPIRRILVSKYQEFRSLHRHSFPLKQALQQLKKFI